MGKYAFLDILIQVMLVTEKIESLLLDIVLLLEKFGDLKEQKSKMLCLARVQKLSIELWLILHAKWYD